MKRFIRGLRPEISKYLVTLGRKAYHDAVQNALLVKIEELRARLVPSQQQMGGTGSRHQGPSRKTSKTSRVSKGRSSAKTLRLCPQCGKGNNATCHLWSGHCLKCGSADHRILDCSETRGQEVMAHPNTS